MSRAYCPSAPAGDAMKRLIPKETRRPPAICMLLPVLLAIVVPSAAYAICSPNETFVAGECYPSTRVVKVQPSPRSPLRQILEESRDGDVIILKSGEHHVIVELRDPEKRQGGYTSEALLINQKRDLTLVGENNAWIKTKETTTDILAITNAHNITLRNIGLMHVTGDAYCEAPAIKIEDSEGVYIFDSILDGSGSRAILVRRSNNIKMLGGEARHNTEGVFHFKDSQNIRINNVVIKDNRNIFGGAAVLGAVNSSSISLSNAVIEGNANSVFIRSDDMSGLTLKGLVFRANDFDTPQGFLRNGIKLGRLPFDHKAGDLSGYDLSGRDMIANRLSGASLVETVFVGAKLYGVRLENASLLRANLSSAELTAAHLSNAYMRDANLVGAIIHQADLIGTTLTGANLTDVELGLSNLQSANLKNANLTRARLHQATLTEAYMPHANFTEADLTGAKLSKSVLQGATLKRATLIDTQMDRTLMAGASLEGAKMNRSNLEAANLTAANLRHANLTKANLNNAVLEKTDLENAIIENADLRDVRLVQANLSNAYLAGADLSGSDLTDANLKDAILTGANLEGAIFMPKVSALPNLVSLANAQNFLGIRFGSEEKSSKGESISVAQAHVLALLTRLRQSFQDLGLRNKESEVTYLFRKRQQALAFKSENLWVRLTAWASFIAFDLTSAYGMKPFRPLIVLLLLILFFFIPYCIAILTSNDAAARYGVFLVRPGISEAPEPILRNRPNVGPAGSVRLFYIVGAAFYFSLHSAFQIGWRDFNVGNWLSRLHPIEFTMVGRGWVRSISGFQSLVSVYLLALTILCYFGRPFAW